MPRLFPITSSLQAKLFGRRSIDRVAAEKEIVCPAEYGQTSPVNIWPIDLARVVKVQEETTLDHELLRIRGYRACHDATVLRVLENSLATPHGVFSFRDSFSRWGSVPIKKALSAPVTSVERGFFAASPISMKYFGHWVTDALTTAYLKDPEESLYLPAPQNWPHAAEYLDLLGIATVPDYTYFSRLTIPEDVGMNANRRTRLERLNNDIRSRFKHGTRQRIFLNRGDSGASRRLVNEPEVIERLQAEGFLVLDVSLPLKELLSSLCNSSIVVGMEGSHFAHALVTGTRETHYVTINPADRFNNVHTDYIISLGGHITTVVAAKRGRGYHLDPDHLLQVIDGLHAKE